MYVASNRRKMKHRLFVSRRSSQTKLKLHSSRSSVRNNTENDVEELILLKSTGGIRMFKMTEHKRIIGQVCLHRSRIIEHRLSIIVYVETKLVRENEHQSDH